MCEWTEINRSLNCCILYRRWLRLLRWTEWIGMKYSCSTAGPESQQWSGYADICAGRSAVASEVFPSTWKKVDRKCRFRLTLREDVCIVNIIVQGDGVTIAERNNKHYFVALDGGAQTPILFDPSERNKIKILLRSAGICAMIYL